MSAPLRCCVQPLHTVAVLGHRKSIPHMWSVCFFQWLGPPKLSFLPNADVSYRSAERSATPQRTARTSDAPHVSARCLYRTSSGAFVPLAAVCQRCESVFRQSQTRTLVVCDLTCAALTLMCILEFLRRADL